jgi:DNA-directed RNA polymerase subunit RPC12/RpoP
LPKYICLDCRHKFTKMLGIVGSVPKCPKCGSEDVAMQHPRGELVDCEQQG